MTVRDVETSAEHAGSTLGPRPKAFDRATDGLPAPRRRFVLVAFIMATLSWIAYLNDLLLPASDNIARVVVNDSSIAVYATVFSVLMVRAELRERRLMAAGRGLLEALPIGVALLDAEFRLSYLNREVGRIVGLRRRDMVGRRLTEFAKAEDASRVVLEERRLAALQSDAFPCRIVRPSGEERHLVALTLPFEDEGRFDGALVVLHDMSTVHRLRGLAEHYEGVSSFLMDAVTHDLSNSLQSVVGRVEMVGRIAGATDARIVRLTHVAGEAAERAMRLVKDVKHIAAAEERAWPTAPATLESLVASALALVEGPAKGHVHVDFEGAAASLKAPASDLSGLALSKLIEEGAEGVAGGDSEIRLVVSARGEGAAGFTVRGRTRALSAEDASRLTAAPSKEAAAATRWRQGVGMALARTVFDAVGWTVAARLDEGRVVFDVSAPLVPGA